LTFCFVLIDIYNANMVAKHEKDNYRHPLNDPHLWLEAGAIDRLDKN